MNSNCNGASSVTQETFIPNAWKNQHLGILPNFNCGQPPVFQIEYLLRSRYPLMPPPFCVFVFHQNTAVNNILFLHLRFYTYFYTLLYFSVLNVHHALFPLYYSN